MSEQGSGGTGGVRTVGHGRYALRDLLGQGGMATVHLADDTVLARPVAIKTMLGEMSREPSFRERFRREAQAVARLNHPNIVQVHDSGEDLNEDGVLVPFIVMEYVEGSTLSSVLRKDIAQHGAMPTDRALKITGEVLSALAVSHEQGLVHRDIKPANVMVTPRDVVKVMDFGIARAMQSGVTSMTQTGMVVGTPQYLSPEQALGKSVDARSDLYSVGCLLFELLTGRLPFESESALGMAYQHVQETPPAPSSFNAAVPPGVDALVARALRKDPSHRFPDADTMRTECERVSGGGGNTPLLIGEGPRVGAPGVGGSGANTVFPQAQGQLGTMPPAPQQPYRPMPPQPYPGQQQQYPGRPQYPGQQPYTGQQQAVPQSPPPYGPGLPPQQQPYQQRPQFQQPMPPRQSAPPRPQPQTPPPYPRPGGQTPPPFRPAPTPPPQRPPIRPATPPPGMPVRPGGVPMPPAGRPNNSARGCGIAAIVVVVIIAVLVLLGLIGALAERNQDDGNALGRPAPIAAVSGPVTGAPALTSRYAD